MRLTEAHARYWQERKATPLWVRRMRADRNPRSGLTVNLTSVHGCVNAHAGIRLENYHLDAHNTLAILRSARKHGEFMEVLQRMAVRPECAIRPERRGGYCRKWLARIIKDRTAQDTRDMGRIVGAALQLLNDWEQR